MAIVDRERSALAVPYAMEVPDRARKERYFDPDFYQMEAEQPVQIGETRAEPVAVLIEGTRAEPLRPHQVGARHRKHDGIGRTRAAIPVEQRDE